MDNKEKIESVAAIIDLEGFAGVDQRGTYWCVPAKAWLPRSESVFYRWLDDDGDAFRLVAMLADKFGIEMMFGIFLGMDFEDAPAGERGVSALCAAGRFAIVSAALEVGRYKADEL